MTKFFKKSQKPYFGPILDPFAQIWVKNEFSWKKGLCQAFNIRINLPLCQKPEKPNEPFLRKLLDGYTKNQFFQLISSSNTDNFRVLRLIEKSNNLTKSNLGHISGIRISPNLKFVQAYSNYNNTNFH